MKKITITSQIELEEHLGNQHPKNPYKFVSLLENLQKTHTNSTYHRVLFNKGRYFETTIMDKVLRSSIACAIKSKIKHNTMIVDSWRKLEAFVKAMNKRGYYVHIKIDWI